MIVVSGGLGFIGQHLIARLVEQATHPLNICIIDDGSAYQQGQQDQQDQQDQQVLIVFQILQKKWLELSSLSHCFYLHQVDISIEEQLDKVFQELKKSQQTISCLYHLAGRKSIQESLLDPELYYRVNYIGGKMLFEKALSFGCRSFIFSSTATVYQNDCPPTGFSEEMASTPEKIPHMYGRSKRLFELYLEQDLGSRQYKKPLQITILRYFNPVSNHPSGIFQESIVKATNLFPALAQSLLKETNFYVYGNKYPNTPDGSCLRDFIHVMDLVDAHIVFSNKANQGINNCKNNITIFNVGRGHGESVLHIVSQFQEKISHNQARNQGWRYLIAPPREKDIVICFANTAKITTTTNWQPQYHVSDMLDHFLKAHLI